MDIRWIRGILGLSNYWRNVCNRIGIYAINVDVYTPHYYTHFLLIQDKKVHGSILGIITSVIAWIPILGMLMHILTAVFLMIDAYQTQKRDTMIID